MSGGTVLLVLRLTGAPGVTVAGAHVPLRSRRLALLAYLALEGEQSRARLAALLFPALDPEEGRARLRLDLHRALHSPLRAGLVADGERVSLVGECDVWRFRQALAAGDWAGALGVWRGPLLEDVTFDDAPALQEWLEARRAGLALDVTRALQGRMGVYDGDGQPDAALEVQRALLAHQPLSEAACDALTRRLARMGRRAEALEEQARFRARFVEALGLEPLLEHRLIADGAGGPGVGAAPEAGGTGPRGGLTRPPLVGREGLWQQLSDWHAAPGGPALLLLGEGGVGKSRLAGAFAEHVGGRTLALRGAEAAQDVPFGALLTALREAGTERLGTLEPRVLAALAEVLPEVNVPRAAGRAGRGALEGVSEARLLDALAAALRAAATGADLLLLDDLHWLDPSSVRVLVQAERQLRGGGPRLLATARPGELRGHLPLARWLNDLERAGRLDRLEVPPLSEVSVLRLIRLLSGSARATGFARALHGLSGGNPYALLAFVQGLVSRGHLDTGGPDGWTLHLDLADLAGELPSTLRGVLLHTLRSRGEDVVRVLEAAALRGLQFEPDAAVAGSGLDGAAGAAALVLAAEHRWTLALPDGRARLEHDLLRQALLDDLAPDRAREVHLRLARHLDRLQVKGLQAVPPAERARHWEGAGERTMAGPLWLQAAEAAGALWAHREALHALEHALACTSGAAERLPLHRQRGRHWQALAQLGAWRDELDAADALQREARVPGEDLRLALERTHLLIREGALEAALALTEAWAEGEPGPERGLLQHERGSVLLELGRHAEAHAVLTAALAEAEPGSLLAANLHTTLAAVAYEQRDAPGGLRHAARAAETFHALGRVQGLVAAHVNASDLHLLAGDRDAARSALEVALGHALASQQFRLIQHTLLGLVDVTREQGDVAAGMRYATQGLEAAEREEHPSGVAAFTAALADFRSARRTPDAGSGSEAGQRSGTETPT